MKNNLKEIIVTVCLIIVTMLLLNPFMFWMPDMMLMGALVIMLVLFALLASFILKEKIGDEREESHRTFAGRNAFLGGASILIIALIFQGYSHSIDPWIVVTLVSMIIIKVGTRIYTDTYL